MWCSQNHCFQAQSWTLELCFFILCPSVSLRSTQSEGTFRTTQVEANREGSQAALANTLSQKTKPREVEKAMQIISPLNCHRSHQECSLLWRWEVTFSQTAATLRMTCSDSALGIGARSTQQSSGSCSTQVLIFCVPHLSNTGHSLLFFF